MIDDDFRSVLVPDPTGPGMYRIVEEYVGDLPPVEPGPPLRRATRKPTRGRPATQTEQATTCCDGCGSSHWVTIAAATQTEAGKK